MYVNKIDIRPRPQSIFNEAVLSRQAVLSGKFPKSRGRLPNTGSTVYFSLNDMLRATNKSIKVRIRAF